MIEIRQTEHYASWFESLRDRVARTRIDIAFDGFHLAIPVM
jgi:putative component of toxin-antitoxin plasmid stabilization module